MAEPWFFDVLPCRPAPYPGECLSGYLVRLADANGGVRVWDLVRDLFPTWTAPHQVRLLRWEYPLDDWGRLPLRTQLTAADLTRLTVASWVEKFRPLPVVRRPGGLSPSSVLRSVVHPTLRICPPCVRDEPNLRLLWRLTPVEACLDHGCLLQSHCPTCDRPLAVIEPAQRPLRCTHCDADLRTLPAVAAPEALLTAQRRRQADLQYLLDPAVTLTAPGRPPSEALPPERPRAIGLTCRYLRQQVGLSIAHLAQQMAVAAGTITELETGSRPVALLLYLAYLEALSVTWSACAAVEVPVEFVRRLEEPSFLAGRLCPTLECPNHHPPPGIGVRVLADLPDRRIVRFRCTACGRGFTRSYTGELVTKPRRPPLQPGDPPPIVKSAAEIERLTELGRQGLTNRQIARQLGWGEKTVRMYWIGLNLEASVHVAQAQRRARAVQHRRATLRTRVRTILVTLRAGEEEISLARVSRALGYCADYLRTDPDLVAEVLTVAQPHNAHVRQHRYDTLVARLTDALAEAQQQPEPPRMHQILRRVGITASRLQAAYPELHALVQRTVQTGQAAAQAARRERQAAQINATAAHLVQEGVCLTYKGLLQAAGVDRYYGFGDPFIYDLLTQWIGDPTSTG